MAVKDLPRTTIKSVWLSIEMPADTVTEVRRNGWLWLKLPAAYLSFRLFDTLSRPSEDVRENLHTCKNYSRPIF